MRSSFAAFVLVISLFLIVASLGLFQFQYKKATIEVGKYYFQDYKKYHKNLFFAFPIFEYLVRNITYNTFWELVAMNKSATCINPAEFINKRFVYYFDKDKKRYYLGLPIVPFVNEIDNNTYINYCFDDKLRKKLVYLTHIKNLSKENISDFRIKYEECTLTNPKEGYDTPYICKISIKWNYTYYSDFFKRRTTIKNEYNINKDIISFDRDIFDFYCDYAKQLDYLKVENPIDFESKISWLKSIIDGWKQYNQYPYNLSYIQNIEDEDLILFTLYTELPTSLRLKFIPYGIKNPNLLIAYHIPFYCEKFGGKWENGKCIIQSDKYSECRDENIEEVNMEDIDGIYYNYEYLAFNKTIYEYPILFPTIKINADNNNITDAINENPNLQKLLEFSKKYKIPLLVRSKFLYNKVNCTVGYKIEYEEKKVGSELECKLYCENRRDRYKQCKDYEVIKQNNETICKLEFWVKVKNITISRSSFGIQAFSCINS